MAGTAETIEIARPPKDVFAYATDFSHFPEWQHSVISAQPTSEGPLRVGSSAAMIRQVGPRKLPSTEEIIEHDPPVNWAVRGVGKLPVIATARGKIEPHGDGERSRVTISLEFEARGLGRLLLPFVILPQARKQLVKNEERLKQQLERRESRAR